MAQLPAWKPYLLLANADEEYTEYVNAFSKTGCSVLIVGSVHGKADAVKFLIGAGADVVNAIHDDYTVTALMYAAASGHVEVIKALLENGADLHAKHSNGGTTLLEAATGGGPESMAVLLEAGANHNFVDFDGVMLTYRHAIL